MTTRIHELLDLPESVRKGDFVQDLTGGIAQPERTVQDYAPTVRSRRPSSTLPAAAAALPELAARLEAEGRGAARIAIRVTAWKRRRS